MVLVQLNKEDFVSDIHSLVKAFYPSENVSVCVRGKEVSEPVCLWLDVDYLSGEIRLVLRAAGREAMQAGTQAAGRETAQAGTQAAGREVMQAGTQAAGREAVQDVGLEAGQKQQIRAVAFAVNFEDRKEAKNLLKLHIYQLLSNHTGRTLPWGTLTGVRPAKIPLTMLEAGRTAADIKSYMEKAYGTSREKIGLSIEVAGRELELLRRLDAGNGYSLYIGIPFCPSTCLYCSFTSYPITMWEKRIEDYLDALGKEIAFTAVAFRDRPLNSIYIGGGTPTTLSPRQLGRLLTKLGQSFDFSHLLEYTVEAGRPDSITEDKLKTLLGHGVTRISVNPQTMKQETLDLIGRRHTVSQAAESFLLARRLGFDNINMDLIMGLPEETIADVRHTMDVLKELGPDSITVHSLALKRAARLSMFKEDYADLKIINTQEHLDTAARTCRQMGMLPYYMYRQKNMAGNFENIGYAKEGKACYYNILMMEEKQTIVALGAGSISKRVYPDGQIKRCENVKDVAQYIGRIEEMIERKSVLFND